MKAPRTAAAHVAEFAGNDLAALFDQAATWTREHDDGVMTVLATSVCYVISDEPELDPATDGNTESDTGHGGEQVCLLLFYQGCAKPGCCRDEDGVGIDRDDT